MMKNLIKIGAFGLLAAAVAAQPLSLSAQSTNDKPAAVKKAAGEKKETGKKQGVVPFRGNLAAVDKINKTITVGKRTFQITSETKVTKDGKPAILEDGVVGDSASGAYKTAADGKLVATKVTFGQKAEGKSGEKKSEKKAASPEKKDAKKPEVPK